LPERHSEVIIALISVLTTNPRWCTLQNQVFLENEDRARAMLKNQASARAVPGGVLEGHYFDAGCTVIVLCFFLFLHSLKKNYTQFAAEEESLAV
jgi:hypothetical protein